MQLVRQECWCESDDDARGCVALLGEDAERVQPTSVLVFCPDCAAEQFGYRADEAEGYA